METALAAAVATPIALEVAPFNDEPFAHHWFEKRL
jgi:hypothetical protein